MRTCIALVVLLLAGCSEHGTDASESSAQQSTAVHPDQGHATDSTSVEEESLSSAVAKLFAGILTASIIHPERNAVDEYAAAFGWKKSSPEMNVLLNTERSFAGSLAGHRVLLGTGGSNDIFAIAVVDGFEPTQIRRALRTVLTLQPVASDTAIGQRMDLYKLFDGKTDLGYLSLTYGVAELSLGPGSVGFISKARARAEGIDSP